MKHYPYAPVKAVGVLEEVLPHTLGARIWVEGVEWYAGFDRTIWGSDVEPQEGMIFSIPARRDVRLMRPLPDRPRTKRDEIRSQQWVRKMWCLFAEHLPPKGAA